MALHINLYHEIHKQAERERRDPFKLAGLAGVIFLLLLVLWFFYRTAAVKATEHKRNDLRSQWAALEPQLKAAVENEPKLLAQQVSNQALVERLQGRFYWAPFLEKVQSVVPPQVQILTLTGDFTLDKDKKKSMNVLVRGVAAGAEPRTVAEAFRKSLQVRLSESYSEVTVVFDANSLEDGIEMVQLDGQTLGTATFRIRVQFKPLQAAPPSTPATPAIRKSK